MAAASPEFSIAVIGLGLMGSAACRHLSFAAGETVVGIGPAEPPDWKSHAGVFASHYDEGRLTRIVDKDPVWSLLAARSMERYGQLERETGIVFHRSVGSIRVTPYFNQDGDSTAVAFNVARENGAEVELLRARAVLARRFPYFGFGDGDAALMEGGGAGYINPRAMVEAQLALARKQGARVVRETVVAVEKGQNRVRIVTDGGRAILASRVLIAADMYSKFVVPDRQLALHTLQETILLAEVGPGEESRLHGMPSFIWRLADHKKLFSVYGCPPVKYPDGKTYVKIGGTLWKPGTLATHEEIVDWFHGDGGTEEKEALLEALRRLLPGLRIESVSSKPCIVTYTSQAYPYIDAVDGKPFDEAQIFVVTGGNGAGAKSSDEIGRIAALLVENRKWTYDLDASLFKALFE